MARVTKAQLRHVADNVSEPQLLEIIARYYCNIAVDITKAMCTDALVDGERDYADQQLTDPDLLGQYAFECSDNDGMLSDLSDMIGVVVDDYLVKKKVNKKRTKKTR